MPRQYDFASDGDHITAHHRTDPEQNVSLAQTWITGTGIDREWEHVFRTLLWENTMRNESGELLLGKERAVEILASADDGPLEHLDQQTSAALLESVPHKAC